MNSKDRAKLRSLAQTMPDLTHIGKNGYENSIEQIKEQLESRELVKIKVLKNCDLSAKDMAQTIAELTNSEVVQVMGEKITLYKFSTKKGVEHVL